MNESPDKSKKEGSVFERFNQDEIQHAQGVMSEDITRYIRGEGSLRGVELTEEERALLGKMHAEVRKAREENEARFARGEQNLVEVQFRFSSPDSYRVFSGLVNRMAEGMLRAIDASRMEGQQGKAEKIAVRQAEDEAKLRELERKAGISESQPKDPKEEVRKDIKRFFEATLPEVFRKAHMEKVKDYDSRIRAALGGTPMRPGDTADQLKKDFRFFSGTPWSENFSAEKKEGKS